MKILLVTLEFPPFKGGVGNYYFNLVNNLDDEIVVLLNTESSTNYPVTNNFKIQNSKFKIIKSSFFYNYYWPKWLKLFFKIRKIIKKEKFDLIWCGQVLPVGTVCYLINKFFKAPYFISTHGMDIMLPQQSVRKEKLMMKVLRSAKFITANSQYTKNQLLKLGLAEQKIRVIYPCSAIGGDLSSPGSKTPQIRQKLGLEKGLILLSVGRLVKRKGYDKVIEVMGQLSVKYPNVTYLIVGNGPEEGSIKNQISSIKLSDKVKIYTDVDDEKLKYFYQIADIFIMPARDITGDVEGFGIVYLEAANFKLPAIAGKSGGANEAVIDGQTGIVVDSDSLNEIKEALIKLINNKELRNKLGENAYQRNKREFNWHEQAKNLKEMF